MKNILESQVVYLPKTLYLYTYLWHIHMKMINIVALVLVCIFGIAFAVGALPNLLPSSVEAEIITDKEIYRAKEHINVVISLESSKDIDNVDIDVIGIKNSRGIYKISKLMNKNLTAGPNNITFEYITPSCSPCSGINPGTYYINATVSYGEKTTNVTHSIVIE